MRLCTCCRRSLPDIAFNRDNRPGRHRSICKRCHREQARQWSAENRERRAAYRRATRERRVAQNAEHRRQHPEQERAQELLQYAIRKGAVHKPPGCTSCFRICVTHGHHDDYSRPLEVVWLCSACHTRLHVEKNLRKLQETIDAALNSGRV